MLDAPPALNVKSLALDLGLLSAASAFPILHIVVHNPGQTALAETLVTLTAAISLCLLIYSGLAWKCKSHNKNFLTTILIIIIFFSYAKLEQWFQSFIDHTPALNRLNAHVLHLHYFTIASIFLMFALMLFLIQKISANTIKNITRFSQYTLICLIVIMLFNNIKYSYFKPQIQRDQREASYQGLGTSIMGYNPDIYYIILDGYARADILRSHYNFDNSDFINQLSSLNFQHNQGGFSNYNWTFLSLTSSLNFNYINKLVDPIFPRASEDRTLPYRMIQDNNAARFLKQRGYRYVHLQSTWGATAANAYADEQVTRPSRWINNDLVRALTETTLLKALGPSQSSRLADAHLKNFRELARQGSRPGPKFVFAHFLLPHHPYLFTRSGNILSNATISNQFKFQDMLWEQKEAYLEQLSFLNQQILDIVGQIKRTSTAPPIIIIQSDHGPGLTQGLEFEEFLHVRFSNFAAYLLPEGAPGLIPDGCTPVNQFPYLFNHYFKAELPIWENRHFFSQMGKPFAFTNVSDRIQRFRQGPPGRSRRPAAPRTEVHTRIRDRASGGAG